METLTRHDTNTCDFRLYQCNRVRSRRYHVDTRRCLKNMEINYNRETDRNEIEFCIYINMLQMWLVFVEIKLVRPPDPSAVSDHIVQYHPWQSDLTLLHKSRPTTVGNHFTTSTS